MPPDGPADSGPDRLRAPNLGGIQRAPTADIRYHDRVAETYFDRWERPIQRLTRRIESRWLRDLLSQTDAPRVLLVGAGGGRELEALLPLGAVVTAVDYSQAALEAGRARWADAVTWKHADVHDLSEFPPGSFDAAIALCCFNWFVDPPRAFAEIASRVREGGLVVVSSLNAEHPTERQSRQTVTRQPFSCDALRAIARDAGVTDLSLRAHRVLVDRWSGYQDRWWFRLPLSIEPGLARIAGPRRCKWVWIIGRMPG